MTSNFPAVSQVYADLQSVIEKLLALDASQIESANLVPMQKAVASIGAYVAALHGQIELRALTNNEAVPGVAVKDAIVYRVWNDEELTAQLAQEQFGDEAFTRKLKSPAGIEKLGSEGKALVSMCSRKPEAPKKVVY